MPVGAVKLLLAKGADLKAVADDETAASMAAKRGDSEVARLLGVSEDERRRGGVVPVTLRERGYAIPVAVEKAMALLEKQSHNFIRIGGCNSCHAQDLTSAAAALARARGLSAPKVIAQLPESMRGVGPERMMDLVTFGVGSVAWETFDFGMNGVPRNAYTDAIVRYTKTMQTAAGNWLSPESRRPPMSTGEHQTAALAIYTLQQYTPASDKAESQQAIARAVAWLEKSKPLGTQDRAFQILGLVWGKAGAAGIEARVKALVGTQRADGGWSQLPGMGTDAYATGQALYSLAASGVVAPADEVYQKGLRYLLRSQAEDGSWEVQTRSIWLQPYFESGFPYGHNQWISVAGTAWATMALSMAHEPQTISRR